jgi:hypothetical protein
VPSLRPLLLVAPLAVGLAGAASAVAGDGELTGARFAVSAYSNTVAGAAARRGVLTVATSGRVKVDGSTEVSVQVVHRDHGGGRATLIADGTRWKLTFGAGGRKTLTIGLRIAEVKDAAGCRAGSRATLVAIDDDDRLENGATEDVVRLTFSNPACRWFARQWTNDDDTRVDPPTGGRGGGQRAKAEIVVERA